MPVDKRSGAAASIAQSPDAVRPPEMARSSVARRPVQQSAVETVVMSRVDLRGLMAAGPPARRGGQRRRHASDLTAEVPVVHGPDRRLTPGRHRAPSAAGRHRAQDGVAACATVVIAAPGPLTRPIR